MNHKNRGITLLYWHESVWLFNITQSICTEGTGCNKIESVKHRGVPTNHKSRAILQREYGIHLHLSKARVTALNTHARGIICVFVSLVILKL